MEELFLLIIKETTGTKYNAMRQTAQIAYDKLYRHSLYKNPSYELRSVCFTALQMALDTQHKKFITMALNGLHCIIKDDRFYINLEPEDDSIWLPSQLLRATADISSVISNDDIIVNILHLFLTMACSSSCTLNGRLLIEILSRCGSYWEFGSLSVKAAAVATASQCIRTFCTFLIQESEELKQTAPVGLISHSQAAAGYNEVIPVLQWLCSHLWKQKTNINYSPNKKIGNSCSIYSNECILTLISSLPTNIHYNTHFMSFLWQKFCPTLAAALGTPRMISDKKIYKDTLYIKESESRGYFPIPGLDVSQSRCIYLTSVQLLRIAGTYASMRPMLEALFHRILLLPTPENRTEQLKCVREIFKSPKSLIDISIILHVDKSNTKHNYDEMALFRLMIDAMEECAYEGHRKYQNSDNNSNMTISMHSSLHASVECMVALLQSLHFLCLEDLGESVINVDVVNAINNRFVNLKDCDYMGPLTYQSMTNLPIPYRDKDAESIQNSFDISTSSDSNVGDQCTQNDEASYISEETEGPEEELSPSIEDTSCHEHNQWFYTQINSSMPKRFEIDMYRQHARDFVKTLGNKLVPMLLRLDSCVEVDEAIQKFSSSLCQENLAHFSDFDNLTAINANNIYIAIYSVLLFTLHLKRNGYYEDMTKHVVIPMSEQQFVKSVQNSGILLDFSSDWLRELYQSLLSTDILKILDQNLLYGTNVCAFIDILNDSGGYGPNQFISEWQRLQQTAIKYDDKNNNSKREAAKKVSRRLLTCCWNSMVTVLRSGLGEPQLFKSKFLAFSKKKLHVKTKNKKLNRETMYALCLDGLHLAATLSNNLNLHHLAGKILKLLASNICQSTERNITASEAMSMDVILTGGLYLGSYSPECWQYIFSVCRHVNQLEQDFFSMKNATLSSSSNYGICNVEIRKENNHICKNNQTENISYFNDDETCFLQTPLRTPNTNISSILKFYSKSNETILLNPTDTTKVLSTLSYRMENLFNDAVEKLNLPSLCEFLKNLCKASREELYKSNNATCISNILWWRGREWPMKNMFPLSLLFHRICETTLRIFRSARPLLHLLKVWAITGPHLLHVACHQDRVISKRAIESIHNIVTALLVDKSELPYFQLNEVLLKPFENLLQKHSCDADLQDQIVACLYEIVEAHRDEIRLGWRALFETLRNVRKRIMNISKIFDIFRIFLDSENVLEFANAGLYCILCLLSFLEISSHTTNKTTGIEQNNRNNSINYNVTDKISISRPIDFLHESLNFLEHCSKILGFMYNITDCPTFHSTYKIKNITYTHIIDANIPNSMENFSYFGNDFLQTKNEQHMISYRSLHIDKEVLVKIDDMDKPSGILKVWFLLLDGLTNSLIVCSHIHQAPILQTIFKHFKGLLTNPGIEFSFYCTNHLLIPVIQNWLRSINKMGISWSLVEKNFKHCCCMTTDLVIDFIKMSSPEIWRHTSNRRIKMTQTLKPNHDTSCSKFKVFTEYMNEKVYTDSQHQENNKLSSEEYLQEKRENLKNISNSATLALKQLLIVLIECAAQDQETVARVGVSCVKHVILSTCKLFNEYQWMIACSAIHRACTVTIAPLRQLSFAFHEKSTSLYGDCANVKVAARRDSSIEELTRVYLLAQQVLLFDNQLDQNTFKCNNLTDNRSYSFLLYPQNSGFNSNMDNFLIRIPFKTIVIGLLVNQMLLQLVAKLLLSRLKCIPQAVFMCIFDGYSSSAQPIYDYDLDFRSKEILLRCCLQFLISSLEFDSRPGLKFLMQKVANIEYSANLYKQMTSSWMIYYITLVDSYLNDIVVYNLGTEDLDFILESFSRLNTTTIKKKDNFVRYLFCLQDIWNLICELYLTHHTDCELKHFLPEKNHIKTISRPAGSVSLDNYNIANKHSAETFQSLLNEENINITTLITKYISRSKNYKIDSNSLQRTENEKISLEIEQQRVTSINNDRNHKQISLSQIVTASMELLRSLPSEAEVNLKLLITPTIREAFRMIDYATDLQRT